MLLCGLLAPSGAPNILRTRTADIYDRPGLSNRPIPFLPNLAPASPPPTAPVFDYAPAQTALDLQSARPDLGRSGMTSVSKKGEWVPFSEPGPGRERWKDNGGRQSGGWASDGLGVEEELGIAQEAVPPFVRLLNRDAQRFAQS